jgi:CRISPR-associated protein Csm2
MANVKTVMTKDPSGEQLVENAQQVAKRLVKDGLKRTQIRNIFTEVRRIEAIWPSPDALRRLNMLSPKMAYQAKRKREVSYLQEVLSEAIDFVNKAESDEERNQRFQRFVDFFEAILAYHRAKGGSN